MPMFGKSYTRLQIAEAVHRGVCQYTGTDGRGCCRWYALGGFMLLNHMGVEAHIQCGSLNVQPDPDDPTLWITMDPSSGTHGEFHCWLASPDHQLNPGGNLFSSGSIIDFSTRHLTRYVEDGGAGTWHREPPPPYIWADFSELPKWYEAVPTNAVGQGREVAHFFPVAVAHLDVGDLEFLQHEPLISLRVPPHTATRLPSRSPCHSSVGQARTNRFFQSRA